MREAGEAIESRKLHIGNSMVWLAAAVVCGLDHVMKLWAIQVLAAESPTGELIPGRPIVLLENFLRLSFAKNRGGAAGLLSSHPQLLTTLSVVALAIIIWWTHKTPPEHRFTRLGFAVILGGAIGNLLDRLFRGGFIFNTYVVDFIEAHWYDRLHWPTFNVADSAICTGIAVILAANLIGGEHAAAPEATSPPTGPPREK